MFDEIMRLAEQQRAPPVLIVSLAAGQVLLWPAAKLAETYIVPVCPVRVRVVCPLAASQSRTVPSSPPVAIRVPSGLKAIAPKALAPRSRAIRFPERASHTEPPSPPAVASSVPSGLKATARP